LTASVQAVAEGFGGAVLIEGEPGIGKSSLLREIIERAQRLRINVLSAAGGGTRTAAPVRPGQRLPWISPDGGPPTFWDRANPAP
jgi:predicted ATP-dependent serine protease